MKAPHCLFNSAIALRQVFISNAATLQGPAQLQRMLLPAVTSSRAPSSWSSPSRRPFSTSTVRPGGQLNFIRRPNSYANAAAENKENAAKAGPLRDHDIVYPWIQLRQENGRLSEPRRTMAVLRSMNLDQQTLILLAAPTMNHSSKGPQYPICRIGDRKVENQPVVSVAKKQATKVVLKQVEVNWAIAPNDMRTKTTQLKKFLSKGYKVDVIMARPRKKNKRPATQDEAKEVLRGVKEAVEEIPGSIEWKPMEGLLGQTLTLHLQGPAKTVSAPASAPASETKSVTPTQDTTEPARSAVSEGQ